MIPLLLPAVLFVSLVACNNRCSAGLYCQGAELVHCKSGEAWWMGKWEWEEDCGELFVDGVCVEFGDDRGATCASQRLQKCHNGHPPSCDGTAFQVYCSGGGETGPERGYLQRTECAKEDPGATCLPSWASYGGCRPAGYVDTDPPSGGKAASEDPPVVDAAPGAAPAAAAE